MLCIEVLFLSYFWVILNHGVRILNRRYKLCVSIVKTLLKSGSLWSHPRLGNLNETRNASSPGFFLKILNSVFKSINMGLDHKFLLQLFVIGFCLFFRRMGFSAIFSKSSLTAGMFLRALSNPFFKSKIPLGYPKILMILTFIII